MGRNNQSRRAAKARQRARQRARFQDRSGDQQRPPGYATDPGPGLPPLLHARGVWDLAARRRQGWRATSGPDPDHLLDAMDRALRDRAAESLLTETVAMLWQHGWQPAELHRQIRVRMSAGAGLLVAAAITAERDASPSEPVHPTWADQVDRLRVKGPSGDGWIARWRERCALDDLEAREQIATMLAGLRDLPALEQLVPPPGAQPSPSAGVRSSAADPTLQRIRGLLAKAESTEFEAEATALTAKAQELMTRHAIDQAMLQGAAGAEKPSMFRIDIDAPYADAKSWLLQVIAEASRCRSVFMPQVTMSTVVGDATDVAGVELLYTSLLVQAQAALGEAARHAGPGARTRSKAYRSSFLLGFSHRIQERLEEANRHVFDAAAGESGRFLPVLRARSEALEDFMSQRFQLRAGPVRGGYDGAGWVGGELAGDVAPLRAGDLVAGPDRP